MQTYVKVTKRNQLGLLLKVTSNITSYFYRNVTGVYTCKYLSGFSGAGEVYKYFFDGVYIYFSGAGEVYKYFSGGAYKYFFDGVYKYFSGGVAGEVYINTSPAFFGAGEESGNCRPIYIYIYIYIRRRIR